MVSPRSTLKKEKLRYNLPILKVNLSGLILGLFWCKLSIHYKIGSTWKGSILSLDQAYTTVCISLAVWKKGLLVCVLFCESSELVNSTWEEIKLTPKNSDNPMVSTTSLLKQSLGIETIPCTMTCNTDEWTTILLFW